MHSDSITVEYDNSKTIIITGLLRANRPRNKEK
jgi:hypothetical protein